MSRFCILDPSLKDFRGHHFMLTDIASRSAEAAGMTVVWLAASSATGSISRPGVTVVPWFSMSMYDAYKSAKNPGLLTRLRRKADAMLGHGKKPAIPDPAPGLARELKRAIAKYAGEEARFFVHTADGAIYRAVAAVKKDIAKTPALKVHLCTPYDPAGIMPNKGPDGAVDDAIAQLKSAGLIGTQVFLHAENPFLAEHLSSLWGASVTPLEIPAAVDLTDDVAKNRDALVARISAVEGAFIVSSLGPARLEKGFDLFPAIIHETKARLSRGDVPGLSERSVHFALHAAPQIVGRDPKIQAALDVIEAESADMATLLKEPLSQEEYAALLHLCDAVLLPYDAQKYRVRGSGAVIEAIAAGKIIIAMKDSYPARAIGPGAGESVKTPEEFAVAICNIAAASAPYRTAASAAALEYASRNTVAGYVEKILAVENP